MVLLLMSGCVSTDAARDVAQPVSPSSTEQSPQGEDVSPSGSKNTDKLERADSDQPDQNVVEPELPSGESSSSPRPYTREGSKVHGYYAWWTRGLWLDIDLSVYDKLFFFTVTPGADGSIRERNGWPYAWVGLARKADSLNIPLVPTLAMLEPDSIRVLFSDSVSIERLIASSITLLEESDGAGLHIDIELFEAANDTIRAGFQHYAESLAEAADSLFPRAELSMFVPALQQAGLIDVSRIPDQFTEIMVQGYDIHWQTGPRAGPVAPLAGWDGSNWQAIDSTFRSLEIDPTRLVMTVPYYGYEWPVQSGQPGAETRGHGRIITYAQVDSLNLPDLQISARERIARHGMKRDAESGSPWYAWRDSTGWIQGWYEDEESLRSKYQFLEDRRFGGIAVFPIGYDAGLLDTLLIEAFGARPLNSDLMGR